MTEEARMIRDIHNFVRGKMDMEEGTDLIKKVTPPDDWIDHLLFDM